MDKADLKVTIDKGMLTIAGEKKQEAAWGEEGTNFYRREIYRGVFARTLQLVRFIKLIATMTSIHVIVFIFQSDQPQDASDKVKATYRDGIMHITIPKNKELQTVKQIGID